MVICTPAAPPEFNLHKNLTCAFAIQPAAFFTRASISTRIPSRSLRLKKPESIRRAERLASVPRGIGPREALLIHARQLLQLGCGLLGCFLED